MKNKLLILLLSVLSFSAFGQSGSLSQSVYRSRVLDSTSVTTPTGWGLLYFNTQRTPATWVFSNDNGATWHALGSGTGGGGTPGGSDTQVQYNDSGAFGGEADMTYNESTNTLTVDNLAVDTEVYDATGWNGDLTVPTKDAVRDKIETLGAGSVSSVSGTTNRITSTGGSTPVIDISASYVGQSSITTTGTLTSGSTGTGYTLSFTNSTLSGRIAEANMVAKYVYNKSTPSTASGTITLDCNSAMFSKFLPGSTFSGGKTLALSNTTGAESFNWFFEITNVAAALTVPSDWIMMDANFDGTAWTPTQIGKFELGGDFDGTNWHIKINGPLF